MQKGRKFSALVSYFQTLAQEHVSIKHSASNKHFFRFELDEILTGLPESACYPVLIMEGYSFVFNDQKSDNPTKRRRAAFVIADRISDPGDYEVIHQTWDRLEEIGDDFLARIRADKRTPNNPVRDFDLNSVEANLIGTEFGNLYGIRYVFEIEGFFAAEVDPAKWLSL